VRFRAPAIVRLERALAHNFSHHRCDDGSARKARRGSPRGARPPRYGPTRSQVKRSAGPVSGRQYRRQADTPGGCHRMWGSGCSGAASAVSVPPPAFPSSVRMMPTVVTPWRCRLGPDPNGPATSSSTDCG
jgi:hypothetical protein